MTDDRRLDLSRLELEQNCRTYWCMIVQFASQTRLVEIVLGPLLSAEAEM